MVARKIYFVWKKTALENVIIKDIGFGFQAARRFPEGFKQHNVDFSLVEWNIHWVTADSNITVSEKFVMLLKQGVKGQGKQWTLCPSHTRSYKSLQEGNVVLSVED